MRPVLLEMDGFASFRQRTTVDFDDVDYFALVGPTGAGKSTVIDAIAFSLYGCVARWDDARAVEPALAPTVNRGTVRLVFDARGERYQVLRELRRNAAGKVQQKIARLERLLDPTARGDVKDVIELVAGTIGETASAVEELLGLDFNQFTKCVALPQGEFAEFLHAKPADRDKILTKLLGLDTYLALGRTAGARASRLHTQADTLQAQLDRESGEYGDDALTAAATRLEQLSALTKRVDTDLAALSKLRAEHDTTALTVTELASALALLDTAAAPAGLDTLDADITAARTALDEAKKQALSAEKIDASARDALRAHPSRASLERLATAHRDAARLRSAAPAAHTRTTATGKAQQKALAARDKADRARQAAHAAHTTAAQEAANRARDLNVATEQLALLQAVRTPTDLQQLLDELADADTATAAAAERRTIAEAARRSAASAAAGLPDPVTLERVRSALTQNATALRALNGAVEDAAAAHKQAHADATTAAAAGAALDAAETDAASSASRAAAAALRAHLSDGDTCPVCEQQVSTVPDPLDATDAEQAAAAVTHARDHATEASQAAARSDATLTGRTAAVTGAARSLTSALTGAAAALTKLPDPPTLPVTPDVAAIVTLTAATSAGDAAAVLRAAATEIHSAEETLTSAMATLDTMTQARERADDAVTAAVAALAAAEQTLESALSENADLQQRAADARALLRATRDPLVALGAPAVDDADLPAAWQSLTSWAQTAAATARTAVAAARSADDAATRAASEATEALSAATETVEQARDAHETAVREHEQALADERTLTSRLLELDEFLADVPSSEQVVAQLQTLEELEQAAAAADTGLHTARETRQAAVEAVDALAAQQSKARTDLTRARDPLVALGAPALPDELSLKDAWAQLLTWAEQTRASKAAEHEQASAVLVQRAAAVTAAEQALRDEVDAADVDSTDPRPISEWAAVAVAAARSTADAAVHEIRTAQARYTDVQQQIRAARSDAHVAGELARLLAINGFPRWLSKSALEVLVTAASTTLMELSGKQFELALATNETASFTVIDHTDADATRPVKTLSGGETFQASLALALALSTHLGALASNGAAQLEAIFIDEGFGTLDETTLDTVATTLEALASSAGRMVGVITHVPALAARVPIRFAVQRDPRGSSITRVSA